MTVPHLEWRAVLKNRTFSGARFWLCLQTFDPRIFGARRHHPPSCIEKLQYYNFWRKINLVSFLFQSYPEHMHLTQKILGLSADPCLVFTVFLVLLKINTLRIFGCRSDLHLQDYLYDGSSSQMQMFFSYKHIKYMCTVVLSPGRFMPSFTLLAGRTEILDSLKATLWGGC